MLVFLKKNHTDEENLIFDEAFIYKIGEEI
jgi:hypothetical protein